MTSTDGPGFRRLDDLERMMSYIWRLEHEVERLLKELKNRDALLWEAAREIREHARRLARDSEEDEPLHALADKIEAALRGGENAGR